MHELMEYFKRLEGRLDRIEAALGFEPDGFSEVRRLLGEANVIQAIKKYREITGASLYESKQAVDAMRAG